VAFIEREIKIAQNKLYLSQTELL